MGTSSPSTKLHVDGTATVDRIINATTSSDPWLKGVNGSGTETSFIKKDGTGYLTKLGIGTTSPTYMLDVQGTNAALRLKSTASTGFIADQNASTGLVTLINYDSGADLRFGTASTERMRINSSGFVGINESSPGAQLTVKRANTSTSGLSGVLKLKQGIATNGNRASLLFSSLDDFDVAAVNGVIEIHSGSESNNVGRLEFYTKASGSSIAERMRIDSSGRLLVGTTTYTGNGQVAIAGNSSGSSAAGCLDIRPTLSRPTAANTTLSLIRFGAADHSNNTGYASINVSSDGASSSEADLPGRLEFHTTPDGASAPTERMRIASDGNVLIGTTTGNNATGVGVKLRVNSTASVDLVFDRSDNVNLNHVYNMNATRNGYRYYLSLDGGIRNFSSNNVNLSDEREKKNIVDMNSTWSDLKQWTLRQFHFNDQNDSEDKRYGVIAQQIETVSPQVLSTFEIDPTTVRKGVKETQMMWMAIKALQEAQERIETLEANVAALEAQM